MPIDVTENYIRIRVRELNLFIEESFRTIDLSVEQGIKTIIGKLKAEPQGNTVIQSYLFDKNKWTINEAEKWVSGHEKSIKPIENKYNHSLTFQIKSFDDTNRTFTAVASTETKDRGGDVLRSSGWQLDNFKTNPVLLWAHQYSELPVGKVIDIRVEKNKLLFTPKFATKEEYEFADTVYKLYKGGYINAFSVGFNPQEWVWVEDEDGNVIGREFTKQELLEISCVPVPANFESLQERSFQDIIIKSFNNSKVEDIKKADISVKEDIKKEDIKKEDIKKEDIDLKENEPIQTKTIATIDNLLSIPTFKNIDEYIDVLTMIKSGRIISSKNAEAIQSAIEHMQSAIDKCRELLKLSSVNEEPVVDEEGNNAFQKLINETNEMLKKVKKI